MTNVTVTEAIAYDCGHRAGHAARDAEVEALRKALRAILAEADTMAMTMRRRAVFEAGRAAADKAERRT